MNAEAPGKAPRTTTRIVTGAVGVALACSLVACSEPAREELVDVGEALNRAGEALDAAIRQSAQDVKPHAKEAGQEMIESLSEARAKLEQTGEVVDQATDSVAEGDASKLDPDAVACAEERYTVTREVAQRVAESPVSLALEAGVEQTDQGARITEVPAGGILARLGLREGDVVIGVSGLDLQGPMDRPLEERLVSKEVTLTIDRAGRRIQKTISIADTQSAAGS